MMELKKTVNRLFLLVVCFISAITAQGQVQENSIKVQQVFSPKNNTFYNEVDSFDIIIRIRNLGPEIILAGDQFNLSYSIGDGGIGTQSFDTLLQVGDSTSAFNRGNMPVNQLREYVIARNYKINGNNLFAVCADVKEGTVLYPINPLKDAGDCVQFTVGIEDQKPSISKLYYANNTINFSLNNPSDHLNIEVYDITGKVLLRKTLKNQFEQSISMGEQNKGFYFLKLISQKGESVTAKFVVN